MRERYRPGLIKALLSKVVRIETEPREAALNKHLQRMDELRKQEIASIMALIDSTDGSASKMEAHLDALHNAGMEYARRQVEGITPVRELVIFNSKRLPLE